MAYGHAERNLDLIRQLGAETGQLLDGLAQVDGLAQPDPDEPAWLQEAVSSGK